MMELVLGIVAIAIVIVGNVIGWTYAISHNSKIEARRDGKYEERLNTIVKEINGLPCKNNPEYLQDLGAMVQNQKETNRRLSRIEAKIFNGD